MSGEIATGQDGIAAVRELASARKRILEQVRRVIVGQDQVIDELLLGLFADGHCLLVGVPGLAKTLLISTLAQILDLEFNRIQFTPDLMPSDITGTEILEENRATGERIFKFVRGPSSFSPRRTRSSWRAPIRCPRPNWIASCSASPSVIRTKARKCRS
jgi:hypothetical protein